MKQNLQEIKRMQFLAGIVSEQADIYSGEEQEVGRLGEVRPEIDPLAELAKGLDQASIKYKMFAEGEFGEDAVIKMIHPGTRDVIYAFEDNGGITLDGVLGDDGTNVENVSVGEALEYLKRLYAGGKRKKIPVGNNQDPDKATLDRWYDRIQTEYLDNNPEAEDLDPIEFNDKCQQHMSEWMGVRDEYNDDIEAYLEDLIKTGDWL